MCGHAVTAFDNKIYVVGRYTWNNQVLIFDGQDWEYGTPLPSARRNASIIEFDGYLYKLMGTINAGTSISNSIKRLENGSWVEKYAILEPYHVVVTAGLAVLNDHIYQIGGHCNVAQKYVKKYDGGTGWTKLSLTDELLYGQEVHHSIAVYNGRIYVTGQNGDRVYSYDGTDTPRWTQHASLPVSFNNKIHTTLVFEDRIHTIGGTNHFSWVPGESSWTTEAAFPQDLWRTGGAVLGEHIYIIGGSLTGSTNSYYFKNTVYRYPALTSGVSPASGYKTGGFEVTISGTQLTDGTVDDITSVKLAGVEVDEIISVNQNADGNCTIVVRAASSSSALTGDVEIVSTAYGTISQTDAFTYQNPPVDFPSGVGTGVGEGLATINPSQDLYYAASQSLDTFPAVNNPDFSPLYSAVLSGSGTVDISISTSASWGACYHSGGWISQVNDGGTISFSNVDFDAKGDVAILLGDEDPTLPVELSSFTGVALSMNSVRLSWITSSESNLNGYYVLRSISPDLVLAQVVSGLINATNTSSTHNYIWEDHELFEPGDYYYWLMVSELDGSMAYHGPVMVNLLDPNDHGSPGVPQETKLLMAHPNPFNPSTQIRYMVDSSASVDIDIYNSYGKRVWSNRIHHAQPGVYSILWDGVDEHGKTVASGLYLYRMSSGKYIETKKMVLLK
jgi:hypothetical protein